MIEADRRALDGSPVTGRRRKGRPSRGEWVAREGWLVWALVILVGAVLPVTRLMGWESDDRWSLAAGLTHAVEFGVLAFLVAVGWKRRVPGSSGVLPAIVLAAVYGLIVELLQGPIPYRDFDWRDLGFDAAGIAAGLLLLALVRRARLTRGWSRPA